MFGKSQRHVTHSPSLQEVGKDFYPISLSTLFLTPLYLTNEFLNINAYALNVLNVEK